MNNEAENQEASFSLEGEARLELVDQALDAISTFDVGDRRDSREDRDLFMLAVSEITTNIVQHSDGAVSVRMELEVGAEEIRAVIRDTAPAVNLDWTEVSLPDDETAESGRGLSLARAVLDGIELTSSPAGNTWTLFRRLRGTGPAQD